MIEFAHKCLPLSEENCMSVPVMYFYSSFVYDNMVITVTDDGHIGAQTSSPEYPRWSANLAAEHLPEDIYQAAILWRKSNIDMPIYDFLNAMFDL